MKMMPSSRSWSCSGEAMAALCAIGLATGFSGCSPGAETPATGLAADPSALSGEFITYVADFEDGHTERWHALRQTGGREIRLEFDTPPAVEAGRQVWLRGNPMGDHQLHVTDLELATAPSAVRVGALSADNPNPPDPIAAPATDSYAIVLVDLGAGVNMTAAQAQARLNGTAATDLSFAQYYNDSSYGKYAVTGTVLGPYQFTTTTCDTSGMAAAIEAIDPAVTGAYNHLIYYFNRFTPCAFGGLGEEGSSARPSKRTWMNGSLGCVVLMQEPGHNLGLMHANTMRCGTTSFSTTPATSCTITEYGSSLTTMGGGCRTLNAYERWYMQWMTGCNGVTVHGGGSFNLLPLATSCPGGVQVLQIPFPAPLTVSDPQATTTAVTLRNYYVELRTQTGQFDGVVPRAGGGGGVTFAGPTVFIYVSDNVRVPAATGRSQNSVWTELLTTTPGGTAMTGLTAAGQSFVDPAGGATITLQAISATGATVNVTTPGVTSTPATCIDGTTLAAAGPAICGGPATGVGGSTGTGTDAGVGAGGAPGTGGRPGTDGGAIGTGGRAGTDSGTVTPPGGDAGAVLTGAGGGSSVGGGTGGAAGATGGVGDKSGVVSGGCDCSVPTGGAPIGTGIAGAIALGLLRRRRRSVR